MLSLMIFDHLSDLLYIKGNKVFLDHVKEQAVSQGLSSPNRTPCDLDKDLNNKEGFCFKSSYSRNIDPNVVVQMFSPLVTSYRVMGSQFGNPYSTIECEDKTTMFFQEYAGCVFIGIGIQTEQYLQRFVNISIELTKSTVGLHVSVLKTNQTKCKLLDKLLSTWMYMYASDQSYLIEANEKLVINSDVLTTSTNALSDAVKKLKKCPDLKHSHAVLLAGNKLLSLFTSSDCEKISNSNLLLLNLLAKSHSLNEENFAFITLNGRIDVTSPLPDESNEETEWDQSEDEARGQLSPEPGKEGINLELNMDIHTLLLRTSKCDLVPHAIYFYPISSSLSLLFISELAHSTVANQLFEVASSLQSLKSDETKPEAFRLTEKIYTFIRSSQELAKKMPKISSIKTRKKIVQVATRFETLKSSHFEEWLKSSETEMPSWVESSLSAMIEVSKAAWYCAVNVEIPEALYYFEAATRIVKESTLSIIPQLEPKILSSMSQSSCSILSMNKYMEEFPGLVHFLYIDRSEHQLTAPILRSCNVGVSDDMVENLTWAKVQTMVDFAWEHLGKGRTSILWKDQTFSYSYFLWFEDVAGNPLKPSCSEADSSVCDNLPLPGILCGDFYRSYAAKVLPGRDVNSVKIYELFCVHLGLTTSPCILEQTRRLTATIWEIAGVSSTNPQDLFN